MNYTGPLSRSSLLDKKLKSLKKTHDPRFGDVIIYQDHRSETLIACKTSLFNEEKNARQAFTLYMALIKLDSPYICKLIDFKCDINKELCSTSYILNQYYEYPHTDLNKELANRDKKVKAFTNEELLHLLYQQIAAMKTLEEHHLFHGDIRPIHIGFTKPLFISKLILKADEIKDKKNILQVQYNHFKLNENLYLSPFLYEAIASGNLKIDFNPIKEDMFALGLIILELSTGILIQNLYGKNLKFDHASFELVLNAFKNMYSGEEDQLFLSTVLTMLEKDVKDRPGFIEISARMPPYDTVKEYLLNKQPKLENKQEVNYTSTHNNVIRTYLAQTDDWKPQIDHVYKRADRSVEKPKIIPYLDETSVEIIVKDPFTPKSTHSFIKSSRSNHYMSKSPKNSHSIDRKTNVITKVVRTMEEINGKRIEKIETFNVTDSDRIIKIRDEINKI